MLFFAIGVICIVVCFLSYKANGGWIGVIAAIVGFLCAVLTWTFLGARSRNLEEIKEKQQAAVDMYMYSEKTETQWNDLCRTLNYYNEEVLKIDTADYELIDALYAIGSVIGTAVDPTDYMVTITEDTVTFHESYGTPTVQKGGV